MARSSYKLTMLFSFVLLFLLSINIAESRIVSSRIGTNSALICSKIYGANIGDTCFSIMQQFSVTAEAFTTFNPNLNCEKMFVGEWICLDGSSL
ncbi:lysM domain-containing protein ARB_03442-like [Solanum dulcamara]|uniref:lysM domain-containing protein ARB_03442-like n=1 Tax=Solanum dulcamara TaxID=45834 RepID=UPI002484FDEE|nr:lysM domain-containing protein ARB_03442-like [Solanum dulcamara]